MKNYCEIQKSEICAKAMGADAARRMGHHFWDYTADHKKVMPRRVIVLKVWERDCDMCERSYTQVIPATLKAFTGFYDQVSNNAEGPMTIDILTRDDAESVWTYTRDRAMEAFENGCGANAYSV